MHNSFFLYIYSNSLHVSSTPVLIIRRINCINVTSGICHSMQVTVKCAGLDGNPSKKLHTRRSPTQLTYTRCRINTIDSSDDVHRGARNMQRIGINIYMKKRIVRKVGYLQELFKIIMHNVTTSASPLSYCLQNLNHISNC